MIHKWLHFFDIYHQYFQKYRGQDITVVEFGVSHGGSLQMWKHYFGDKVRIIGIDIDPRCKQFEEAQIEIFIGDQENRKFLQEIRSKIGPIDLLIEDGGHKSGQQIATFEEFFPMIKPGGLFLIEDLHTSYWSEYGGGFRRDGSFIEYAKNIIDCMHAEYSRDPRLVVGYLTKNVKAMHVFDSVIIFEKIILCLQSINKQVKKQVLIRPRGQAGCFKNTLPVPLFPTYPEHCKPITIFSSKL